MLTKLILAFTLVASSSLAFAVESGYQTIGRVQQWAVLVGGMGAPAMNVFLAGPANICGSNIYTLNHEQVEAARGKNAASIILAAKVSGKKLNITYECIAGTAAASIWGVDIE